MAEELKNLDKKKAQTLLSEIDPSVHRTRKLLEEIRLWSKIDPRKALSWTETIPTAFPLEKALAYRDVAIPLKQVESSLSFDLLEKALKRSEEIISETGESPKDMRKGRGSYDRVTTVASLFIAAGQLGLADRLTKTRDYLGKSLELINDIPDVFYSALRLDEIADFSRIDLHVGLRIRVCCVSARARLPSGRARRASRLG